VSYYDYYQPEAYIPTSDTYIEKEAQINEEIERLRHASTQALLTRKDVIVVATVSCIYGLGSPVEYEKVNMRIEKGMHISRADLIRRLIDIHYERTTADVESGTFRALGNMIEIMPVSDTIIYRIELSGNTVESITKIDAITREIIEEITLFFLFPAKHFITDPSQIERVLTGIRTELREQLGVFEKEGKILEAERLKRRTTYDLAMIQEIGYCNGIENYSRHFSGKNAGDPPDTLMSYFPHKADGTPDFLTIIDESHVTVPQLNAMYAGDASRKQNLVEHGFRLPSARDNRPLKFPEFEERVGQVIYTSATPGKYELERTEQTVQQLIRPTGLLDPELFVRPVVQKGDYPGQIRDFIAEAEKVIAHGGRVIATTLTKKMSEDLSEFLKEKKIKSEYVHSDIKTIERIQILTNFRKGIFDILVGVNLLREGLDLPEVEFIGILDADKEGFLRSETSLIQTIGRAARNVHGRVVLYADSITGSMERAMGETNRRRTLQMAYNAEHGITPKTIIKNINDITDHIRTEHEKTVHELLRLDKDQFDKNPKALIKDKERQMSEAVEILDFETAAILRDEIAVLVQTLEGQAKAEVKKKNIDLKKNKGGRTGEKKVK
jgi:excinuclease ABC subunit B